LTIGVVVIENLVKVLSLAIQDLLFKKESSEGIRGIPPNVD
jgi:hypothetical protein